MTKRVYKRRRKWATSNKMRVLGGVTFECLEPGCWVSADRMLAIVETFGFNAWELYRTELATGEIKKAPTKLTALTSIAFTMHEMLEHQPRMKDLAREIERASDWAYNLASGFHDAGRSLRFYRNGKIEHLAPKPGKPVDLAPDWRRNAQRLQRSTWPSE